MGGILIGLKDCPWAVVEEDWSFEKEDCPKVFLDFLNNFSGSDTAKTDLGSGFFLVTYFFVDDDNLEEF